jgi:hypothetical protein
LDSLHHWALPESLSWERQVRATQSAVLAH